MRLDIIIQDIIHRPIYIVVDFLLIDKKKQEEKITSSQCMYLKNNI